MENNLKRTITSLNKTKHYIFHFNRIFTVDGVRYHMSTRDFPALSVYFTMIEKNGGWYFSDITKLPTWIIELKRKLEQAIWENV